MIEREGDGYVSLCPELDMTTLSLASKVLRWSDPESANNLNGDYCGHQNDQQYVYLIVCTRCFVSSIRLCDNNP
ncbi:MAG: hypothetical protein ABSH41_18300 [Syntrophobacteraceae bacterium]